MPALTQGEGITPGHGSMRVFLLLLINLFIEFTWCKDFSEASQIALRDTRAVVRF